MARSKVDLKTARLEAAAKLSIDQKVWKFNLDDGYLFGKITQIDRVNFGDTFVNWKNKGQLPECPDLLHDASQFDSVEEVAIYAILSEKQEWFEPFELAKLANLEEIIVETTLDRLKEKKLVVSAQGLKILDKKGFPTFQKDCRSVEYKSTGWKLADNRKSITFTDKMGIAKQFRNNLAKKHPEF